MSTREPHGKDPLDYLSNPKEWEARQYRHRHNGILGKIACARGMLKSISEDSLTSTGVIQRHSAIEALNTLEVHVRTHRREPDGTITLLDHFPEHMTSKRMRNLG